MTRPPDDDLGPRPQETADLRVSQLWVRFLAGESLNNDEQETLVAIVRAGNPAGRALVMDEQLHRTLAALGRSTADEAAFVQRVAALTSADLSANRFVSAVEQRIDGRVRRSRSRRLATGATVALLAAAALALWLRSPRSAHPPSAGQAPMPASVISGQLAAGDRRFRVGEVAPEAADLVAVDGQRACLGLGDRSRLCLEPDSRVRLHVPTSWSNAAGRTVGLHAGKTAVAERHRDPLTVTTAAGPVTARGAVFSVEISRDGDATVRVLEGSATVGDRPPVHTVQAWQALSLATGTRRRLTVDEARAEWSLVAGEPTAPPAAPDGRGAPAAVALAQAGLLEAPPDALMRLAEALRDRGRLQEANGIQSRLLRQQRTAWNPPAPAVYRINAGGPRFIDPHGNVWAADAFFSGGRTFGTSKPIAGTSLEPLYQTERNAVGSPLTYELPVASGNYVVYLHFAEIYSGISATNLRRFDVFLEQEKVLDSYDINGDVGPATAVVRPFLVQVNDGGLTIDLAHVSENPKVSAIEVYPLPPGASPPANVLRPRSGRPRPPTPGSSPRAVYRINAGGPRFVDTEGNTWSADVFSSGGSNSRTREAIEGTYLAPLYRNERFAPPGTKLSYELPVENGRHAVHLHFAEIFAPMAWPNRRKFDVFLQGERVLPSYDIAADVGPFTAVVKAFVTDVRDGRLGIELRPVLENPKISGIEVFALAPGDSPPAVPRPPALLPLPPSASEALYRINAGGGSYIDPEGQRWAPDSYVNDTGRGIEEDIDVQGTDLDRLYVSHRVAKPGRNIFYSLPVTDGEYRLRLHFAETSRAPGKRVFDVLVERTEALSRLDLAASAPLGTAIVKELKVAVVDGVLDVELRPVVGAPRIAALEVLPLESARASEPPATPSADPVASPPPPLPNAGCALGGRPDGVSWAALAALSWLCAIARRRRKFQTV